MDPICPKTNKPCRHCSNEVDRRISRVGIIKTQLIERRETVIKKGAFCNNDGRKFVADLPECPIPAALAVPLVRHEISELEWMRQKGRLS